ncbi:MAG: hypothetical protein WA941_12640 [Nitrososphaeraceae archaeon]
MSLEYCATCGFLICRPDRQREEVARKSIGITEPNIYVKNDSHILGPPTTWVHILLEAIDMLKKYLMKNNGHEKSWP